MALYAIGDIQGCFSCLQRLLDIIEFDPVRDHLWFAGDIVNRGPESLSTLRFIKSLGASATAVLGNHDLHLIATAYGKATSRSRDTIQPILDSPDCIDLIEWLRHRPLFHVKHQYCLVHAGIAPQWTICEAKKYSQEVETVLQGDQIETFLEQMYGNEPNTWSENLSEWERLRFITNVFTRMRYCSLDGALYMKAKHSPADNTKAIIPWFEFSNRQSQEATIVFGHWSALGLQISSEIVALDTGCVWGGHLTAVRLCAHNQVFQTHCKSQA